MEQNVNSQQCLLLHTVRYQNKKLKLYLRWLAVIIYNIYLYHRSLKVNFKLQNVCSALAANILIAMPNPPNVQFSLHIQHNICVTITWV